jgi:hypothetical protein
VETAVFVGRTFVAGAHEANVKATSKIVTMFLIFIDYLIQQGTAQRIAPSSPIGDTRAGAGGGTPSSQKNEKACETAWDMRTPFGQSLTSGSIMTLLPLTANG